MQEQDDSTIIYSGRYLSKKDRNSQLAEFVHYFRGRSFYNKGLYKDAGGDFANISKNFPLYNLVHASQAEVLFKQGEYDTALTIYLNVLEGGDFEKNAISESSINHNAGICYMLKQDYENAEKYLLRSLDQQLKTKDTARIIGGYIDVANLYYEQYLDDKAIPNFVKAYELAYQTDDFVLRRTAALNMAVVEENRGNLEKSLAFRKEYDQWKDSTNNQEKVWEIAQIEKRHLAETKQREIGLLQKKTRLAEQEKELKAKERNTILIGAGVLLLVLVLIIYFYYQKIRSSAIIAEQRESLDKLNAFKNRLFSIVSHDLRSSVHGLRRSTEQLRDEVPSENAQLKSLVNQQGAIANATYGMLDNLLNWALLQSDEIYFHAEKISLKRLVPQVVINYQPLLDQKNISLSTDVPADGKIYADNDSVKIVLRNVLDNAIKFTPENGSLDISAKVEGNQIALRIKDSGPGMTSEQLAMVIDQSSQVSKESGEERSGTGLGVRLCASFMSKNNGSFHIESEEGAGTTVILRFEKA
ncbi:MAG: ATP-binding protein [bacterium]|nr:ATP-binding protein [bacterium]